MLTGEHKIKSPQSSNGDYQLQRETQVASYYSPTPIFL